MPTRINFSVAASFRNFSRARRFRCGCSYTLHSRHPRNKIFRHSASRRRTGPGFGGVRGTINALGNLGGFIGPFLVGYLTTAFSKEVGLSFLIAALVIASALLYTLPKVTSKAPR